MISVQNHPQPLSGNKLKSIFKAFVSILCLGAVLAVSSCSPKTTGGVLKNPNVYGTTGSGSGKDKPKEEDKETKEKDSEKSGKQVSNIALLLPFQLNMIANENVVEDDVKRSALALDFYQGFQLGVNEETKTPGAYNIKVMDTQDNEMTNFSIAASKEVESASLIVGPVYPKEIRSFAKGNKNTKVLQVNPLAATMPREFNIANLVSLTPPIRIHMLAVAKEVMGKYRDGDVIIVFDARDNDHRQFIQGFDEEITTINPNSKVIHVSSIAQLGDALPDLGTALVVSGTTERTQLRSLISALNAKVASGSSIRLFGHPLWARIDFKPYDNFYRMEPTITTESHLKAWGSDVQTFQKNYKNTFKIDPSDYAYKGYDAGRYFTNLLNKYGEEYADKVVEEKYKGIFSDYQFVYNAEWGYVNQAVKVRTYRNGSFQ